MLTKEKIALAAQKWAIDNKKKWPHLSEPEFIAGAQWANEQNAAEIAELLDLLGEVDAYSPAGSGNIPAWLETRSKVRRLLEKYGK